MTSLHAEWQSLRLPCAFFCTAGLVILRTCTTFCLHRFYLYLLCQPPVASNMACCRLGNLLHNGQWNLESAWHIRRHGPSRIPTDQDLPHKAFGSQVVDDSPFDRPEILPFSVYAACRILDTTPDDQVTTVSHLLQNTLNSLCRPKASSQILRCTVKH